MDVRRRCPHLVGGLGSVMACWRMEMFLALSQIKWRKQPGPVSGALLLSWHCSQWHLLHSVPRSARVDLEFPGHLHIVVYFLGRALGFLCHGCGGERREGSSDPETMAWILSLETGRVWWQSPKAVCCWACYAAWKCSPLLMCICYLISYYL